MRQSMVAVVYDPCWWILGCVGLYWLLSGGEFLKKKLGEKEDDHDVTDD